ncbi:MAG: hypothetical protein FJ100_06640 [Deltaproteobacteria bacterium]|nr:hypothetical protein [Deltaproteobacteria bacterium]
MRGRGILGAGLFWVVAGCACGTTPAPTSTASADSVSAVDAVAAADAAAKDAAADAPDPCKGQTCSGVGICKVAAGGKAYCDCAGPACLYPTADLRCVSAGDLCSEAGLACEGGSTCGVDDDPSGCGCDSAKIHKAVCRCDNGAKYDAGQCKSDVAACHSLHKCVPTKGERFNLVVSGAVTLTLVDRKEFGGGQEWTAGGNLTLFNVWPKELCGALKLASGQDLKVGSSDVGQLKLSFAHGGKQYNSEKVGAGGKVEVKAATWCDKPGCTVLDLAIDADLGGFDGSVVHVKGVIKGSDF